MLRKNIYQRSLPPYELDRRENLLGTRMDYSRHPNILLVLNLLGLKSSPKVSKSRNSLAQMYNSASLVLQKLKRIYNHS